MACSGQCLVWSNPKNTWPFAQACASIRKLHWVVSKYRSDFRITVQVICTNSPVARTSCWTRNRCWAQMKVPVDTFSYRPVNTKPFSSVLREQDADRWSCSWHTQRTHSASGLRWWRVRKSYASVLPSGVEPGQGYGSGTVGDACPTLIYRSGLSPRDGLMEPALRFPWWCDVFCLALERCDL